ncbi:MAG: hypothetical protein V4726_03665 [Verrucomicrobiota bacterium]
MFRAARDETLDSSGRRIVAYPRVLRICVMAGWIVVITLPLAARGHGIIDGPRSTVFMACVCLALVLPLHLEVFGSRITWDGYWIYTVSPWRRSRRIAAASVTGCRFSWLLLSYIIRTQKNGLIVVPLFAKGIPGLLSVLPVKPPPYPPLGADRGSE